MIVSLKVTDLNPVHARVSVFTSGKRYGIETLGVGLSGSLCIDAEILEDFVKRVNPDRIRWEVEATPPECIKPYMASEE